MSDDPLDHYTCEADAQRARIRSRACGRCEFCDVPNFAVGGRLKDGQFMPLFQRRDDPAQARALINTRAWCGTTGPEHLLLIVRIVCEVVQVNLDLRYLCQRCRWQVGKVQEARREVAA